MTTNFTVRNDGPSDISVETYQEVIDNSPQTWCFTIVKKGQSYSRSVYGEQSVIIKEVSNSE